MIKRFCFVFIFSIFVCGCASSPSPIVLPKMVPIHISELKDAASVGVVVPKLPDSATGLIPALMNNIAEKSNIIAKESFKNLALKRNFGEKYMILFNGEVKDRFLAKGGVVQVDRVDNQAPEIRFQMLMLVYFSNSSLGNFYPTATVLVDSSTDPPNVGNKPGAVARPVIARIDDLKYSFFTVEELINNPDLIEEGFQAAVIDLAEKVSSMLVIAQRGF